MRLISQSELLRATKLELSAMLRRIAADLPSLPEGSHELRIAHYNLHNIRLALARPDLSVGSDLYLSGMNITALPKGLTVGGKIVGGPKPPRGHCDI